MAAAYRLGKHRRGTGDKRTWRVKAYRSADGYPSDRVQFKDDTGRWTTRTPEPGQSVDELFEAIERALDVDVATSSGARRPGGVDARDLDGLAARYLASLKARHLDDDYIYNRERLLKKWVTDAHGSVLVSDWTPALTAQIIDTAREHLGVARVEDLGVALSGLRKVARAKDEQGRRWLSPDEDPMEGVRYTKSESRRAKGRWVPPSHRPSAKMVAAAIAAAELRGEVLDAPWLPVQVELACTMGLRLSEQLGLYVDDLLHDTREVSVTAVWMDPHGKPPYRRGHTKNLKDREVPFSATLWDKVQAIVPAAQERYEMWAAAKQGPYPAGGLTLAWLRKNNAPYLFVDPATRLPWAQEKFNTEWRRIRTLTTSLANEFPDRYEAWPRSIVYRNARHHAATAWHDDPELMCDWPLVAYLLGDEVETVLAHYVRTHDAARRQLREQLTKR